MFWAAFGLYDRRYVLALWHLAPAGSPSGGVTNLNATKGIRVSGPHRPFKGIYIYIYMWEYREYIYIDREREMHL